MSLKLRFGRNVRSRRRAAGLSQEEFADRCRLHRTYIGAIERGERNVTLATIEKIAAALRADPVDLLREPPR